MAERRTEQLHVRLTTEEAADVAARAMDAGLSVSAYVRRCVLDPGPASRAGALSVQLVALRTALLEVKRQGNNLNQITKELHRYGAGDAALLGEVSATVNEARVAMSRINDVMGSIIWQ